MRLTIKPHNQAFIESLATSLNVPLVEALNFLLLTLQSQNYQIGSSLNVSTTLTAVPQTVQPQTAQPQQLGFAQPVAVDEIDPVIARFVNLGICAEF